MNKAKNLMRIIGIISILLILEPFFKVLILKSQTGLEWSLIWNNILENSQTFQRFFMFWLISPLTGIFLLSFSTTAYLLYFGLSLFRVYSLLTYVSYTWPYMSEYPPAMSILFEVSNLILMSYLFSPFLQRFFLSKYLKNYWDARGRVECHLKTFIFFKGMKNPIEGIIENISSGGVSVSIDSSKIDDKTKIKDGTLTFYDQEGEPLNFHFQIKSNRLDDERILLGLEFLGLSPKDKIILRTLLTDDFLIHERVFC